MKKNFLLIWMVFPMTIILAQEQHTMGPFKDWYCVSWAYDGTDYAQYSYDHLVGLSDTYLFYIYRDVNFWKWTYNDIPTQATVQSVAINFRAYRSTNDMNFRFSLHNFPVNFDSQNVNYYNLFTTGNKLLDTTIAQNTQGYAYFNNTFTSGSIVSAIQTAIQSGNYYLTLGIMQEGPGELPEWIISSYDGSGQYNQPAIALTIVYTTPNQYYTLSNVIQSTTNYGHLIANNNTSNPISSGTQTFFSWGTTNNVRTAELPFDANWNSGGTTQKHDYWYLPNVPATKYFLYDTIVALPQTTFIHNATFDSTSSITAGVSWDLGSVSDSIDFRDPWHYYTNGNNNWVTSNQFIRYATPFTTSNNNGTSYGGVFLSKNPQTSPLYYSVRAPLTKTVSGSSTFFTNWSTTGATYQDGGASGGYDSAAVVFASPGATVTANYKVHLASTTVTALSSNNQRKLVRDILGNYQCVYESAGKVFYTSATASGGPPWSNEVYLSGSVDTAGWTSKNPVVDTYNSGSTYDLPPVYVPVRSLVFSFRHWQTEGDRMSPVPVVCNSMNCVV